MEDQVSLRDRDDLHVSVEVSMSIFLQSNVVK